MIPRFKTWLVPSLGLVAVAVGAALFVHHEYFASAPSNHSTQAIALAQPFDSFPHRIGDWVLASVDEPLDADVREVLGTNQSLYRDYVNVADDNGKCAAHLIAILRAGEDLSLLNDNSTAAVQSARINQTIAQLLLQPELLPAELSEALTAPAANGRTAELRQAALNRVDDLYPDALIRLAANYYSGRADSIAHVPARYFTDHSFVPANSQVPQFLALATNRTLPVRYLNLVSHKSATGELCSVVTFYDVNGQYEADPDNVRQTLLACAANAAFYAKVEVMTFDKMGIDTAHAQLAITDFLGGAIYPLERVLPGEDKAVLASAR